MIPFLPCPDLKVQEAFPRDGGRGREKRVLFPQAPRSSPPVTYVPALSLPHNVKADKDGKDVYFHSWLSLIRIQFCPLASESPSVKWVVALPDEVSEEVHDQSNAQLMEVSYVLIDYVSNISTPARIWGE